MRTPPSGDASSEAPEREARVARVPADLAPAPVREREAPLSTSRAPAPVREARVARVPADLAPVREARVARVPADLAPAPVREREDGNRLLRIKKSPDMIDVVPPSGW